MKLTDLREKLKGERQALLSLDGLNPSIHEKNMRELWTSCRSILFHVDESISKGWSPKNWDLPIYAAMRRVVRAGDLYYHAKKHGVESAMLWKLRQL